MIRFFRGDSLIITCNVRDSKGNSIDLSNYQIRAELGDGRSISIKKANSNVIGGSDDEIHLVSPDTFSVIFTPNDTTQLEPEQEYILEVEITSPDDIKTTIVSEIVKPKADLITWDSK